MPSEAAMRQTVQRARRANQPPVPRTLAAINFQGIMTQTNGGAPFLFHDSGNQVYVLVDAHAQRDSSFFFF